MYGDDDCLQIYICTVCFKKGTSREELEAHLGAHHMKRPFTCKICYAKLLAETDIQVHSDTEHPNLKPDISADVPAHVRNKELMANAIVSLYDKDIIIAQVLTDEKLKKKPMVELKRTNVKINERIRINVQRTKAKSPGPPKLTPQRSTKLPPLRIQLGPRKRAHDSEDESDLDISFDSSTDTASERDTPVKLEWEEKPIKKPKRTETTIVREDSVLTRTESMNHVVKHKPHKQSHDNNTKVPLTKHSANTDPQGGNSPKNQDTRTAKKSGGQFHTNNEAVLTVKAANQNSEGQSSRLNHTLTNAKTISTKSTPNTAKAPPRKKTSNTGALNKQTESASLGLTFPDPRNTVLCNPSPNKTSNTEKVDINKHFEEFISAIEKNRMHLMQLSQEIQDEWENRVTRTMKDNELTHLRSQVEEVSTQLGSANYMDKRTIHIQNKYIAMKRQLDLKEGQMKKDADVIAREYEPIIKFCNNEIMFIENEKKRVQSIVKTGHDHEHINYMLQEIQLLLVHCENTHEKLYKELKDEHDKRIKEYLEQYKRAEQSLSQSKPMNHKQDDLKHLENKQLALQNNFRLRMQKLFEHNRNIKSRLYTYLRSCIECRDDKVAQNKVLEGIQHQKSRLSGLDALVQEEIAKWSPGTEQTRISQQSNSPVLNSPHPQTQTPPRGIDSSTLQQSKNSSKQNNSMAFSNTSNQASMETRVSQQNISVAEPAKPTTAEPTPSGNQEESASGRNLAQRSQDSDTLSQRKSPVMNSSQSRVLQHTISSTSLSQSSESLQQVSAIATECVAQYSILTEQANLSARAGPIPNGTPKETTRTLHQQNQTACLPQQSRSPVLNNSQKDETPQRGINSSSSLQSKNISKQNNPLPSHQISSSHQTSDIALLQKSVHSVMSTLELPNGTPKGRIASDNNFTNSPQSSKTPAEIANQTQQTDALDGFLANELKKLDNDNARVPINIVLHIAEKSRLYQPYLSKLSGHVFANLMKEREVAKCYDVELSNIIWMTYSAINFATKNPDKDLNRTYFCQLCAFVTLKFDSIGGIVDHLITNHESKEFRCPKCKHLESTKERLSLHMEMYHKMTKTTIENIVAALNPVKKSFSKSNIHKNMFIALDLLDDVYICASCQYVPRTLDHMFRHMPVHFNNQIKSYSMEQVICDLRQFCRTVRRDLCPCPIHKVKSTSNSIDDHSTCANTNQYQPPTQVTPMSAVNPFVEDPADYLGTRSFHQPQMSCMSTRPQQQMPVSTNGIHPQQQMHAAINGNQPRQQMPLPINGNQSRQQMPVSSIGNQPRQQMPLSLSGNQLQQQMPVSSNGNQRQQQMPPPISGNQLQRQMPVDSNGNHLQRQIPVSSNGIQPQQQMPVPSIGNQHLSISGNKPQRQMPVSNNGNHLQRHMPVSLNSNQPRQHMPVPSIGNQPRQQMPLPISGNQLQRQMPVSSNGNHLQQQMPVSSSGIQPQQHMPVPSIGYQPRQQMPLPSIGNQPRQQMPMSIIGNLLQRRMPVSGNGNHLQRQMPVSSNGIRPQQQMPMASIGNQPRQQPLPISDNQSQQQMPVSSNSNQPQEQMPVPSFGNQPRQQIPVLFNGNQPQRQMSASIARNQPQQQVPVSVSSNWQQDMPMSYGSAQPQQQMPSSQQMHPSYQTHISQTQSVPTTDPLQMCPSYQTHVSQTQSVPKTHTLQKNNPTTMPSRTIQQNYGKSINSTIDKVIDKIYKNITSSGQTKTVNSVPTTTPISTVTNTKDPPTNLGCNSNTLTTINPEPEMSSPCAIPNLLDVNEERVIKKEPEETDDRNVLLKMYTNPTPVTPEVPQPQTSKHTSDDVTELPDITPPKRRRSSATSNVPEAAKKEVKQILNLDVTTTSLVEERETAENAQPPSPTPTIPYGDENTDIDFDVIINADEDEEEKDDDSDIVSNSIFKNPRKDETESSEKELKSEEMIVREAIRESEETHEKHTSSRATLSDAETKSSCDEVAELFVADDLPEVETEEIEIDLSDDDDTIAGGTDDEDDTPDIMVDEQLDQVENPILSDSVEDEQNDVDSANNADGDDSDDVDENKMRSEPMISKRGTLMVYDKESEYLKEVEEESEKIEDLTIESEQDDGSDDDITIVEEKNVTQYVFVYCKKCTQEHRMTEEKYKRSLAQGLINLAIPPRYINPPTSVNSQKPRFETNREQISITEASNLTRKSGSDSNDKSEIIELAENHLTKSNTSEVIDISSISKPIAKHHRVETISSVEQVTMTNPSQNQQTRQLPPANRTDSTSQSTDETQHHAPILQSGAGAKTRNGPFSFLQQGLQNVRETLKSMGGVRTQKGGGGALRSILPKPANFDPNKIQASKSVSNKIECKQVTKVRPILPKPTDVFQPIIVQVMDVNDEQKGEDDGVSESQESLGSVAMTPPPEDVNTDKDQEEQNMES